MGIGAEVGAVDVEELWLRDGRLWADPGTYAARSYDAHGYMVLAVERLETRPNWPRLPAIGAFQQQFSKIMGAADTPERKQEKLARLWPRFQEVLNGSRDLTTPDRLGIALSVWQDLTARLEAQRAGNPFEARGAPSVPDSADLSRAFRHGSGARLPGPLRPGLPTHSRGRPGAGPVRLNR